MSAWTLVACALDGTPLGELQNAKARTLTFPLNGVPACTFSLRLDNALADEILTTEVLVKAYEGTALRGVYDVMSAEEVVQGTAEDGIQVVCAGPWARMASRLIGKTDPGYTASSMDRGLIARDMIIATNLEDYTGIDVGTINPSATDSVGPWLFKPISEATGELASALDGFDWDVTPVEPTTAYAAGTAGTTGAASPNPSGKPTVGVFNTYAAKGVLRDTVIFEYGTGKHNVKSYRRPVDRSKLLNQAWSLPQGYPDVTIASTVIETSSPDSIAVRGLYEGVVASDLVVDEMRSQLAFEHVRIRESPRQLILFESHIDDPSQPGRVPKFKVDYDVGDVITARAKVNGVTRFDVLLRIYGVNLAISEEGTATPTLQLVTQ